MQARSADLVPLDNGDPQSANAPCRAAAYRLDRRRSPRDPNSALSAVIERHLSPITSGRDSLVWAIIVSAYPIVVISGPRR
jgi:hypothetical protein